MSSKPIPTVEQLRALLAEVTADLALRSVGVWRPVYGPSPARTEVDEERGRLRSDGVTLWGPAPMEVIWKASELLSAAVFEYARSAATLMTPPFRTWAPTVEVRAAVEAASQLSWLLDPKLPDGLTRIGRYYTMRHYAARQLEHTYKQVNPDGPLSDYGKSRADMEAEAATLGLTPVLNKNKDVIGYEGQQIPKLHELSEEIVGDNGAYSMLSGSSHSEIWVLLGGYQHHPPTPLGLSLQEHGAQPETFIPLVRACLQSLFKPLDHVWLMFGRHLLRDDLQRLYEKAVVLIGP
jgi:hypothetical protein